MSQRAKKSIVSDCSFVIMPFSIRIFTACCHSNSPVFAACNTIVENCTAVTLSSGANYYHPHHLLILIYSVKFNIRQSLMSYHITSLHIHYYLQRYTNLYLQDFLYNEGDIPSFFENILEKYSASLNPTLADISLTE